jgi:rubrerythrin
MMIRSISYSKIRLSLSVLSVLFCSLAAQAANPFQKSITNLNTALQGEANAVNRYRLFAQEADDEGYPQIAQLFRAIAKSESIHRENHRKAIVSLGGEPAKIVLQSVTVRSTRENLELPIKSETKEQSETYPQFIKQAEREEAGQAVRTFQFARDAEMEHDKLFRSALANLGQNPREDYYVSEVTGDTVAIPKVQSDEYLRTD